MSDYQPISDQYLDEIEAWCNAATPGPWYISSSKPPIVSCGTDMTLDSAKFICKAREVAPRLVAEVRRLLAELQGAEPVRHGRWIEVTNDRGGHCCSECREYAPSFKNGDENLAVRCHCCGAKMDADDPERRGAKNENN